VDLKGLEWSVARSESRRVAWSGGERTGDSVEWPDRSGGGWNGQIGVEESEMEWS
jgi:hypothetical protein